MYFNRDVFYDIVLFFYLKSIRWKNAGNKIFHTIYFAVIQWAVDLAAIEVASETM